MSCEEIEKLLDGYVDGELDLVRNLEIEGHLQSCPACATIYQNQLVLKKALKTSALYYKPPASLEKQIHASLKKVSKKNAPLPVYLSPRHWLVVAASLALILMVGWAATQIVSTPSKDELLHQQVVASHIRSLMAAHLKDVNSTDQHTVKPWFDGKLDFSPSVTDFADKGFPLVGGRLDYLDNRPVAAVVYQRREHVINVFIWPAPNSPDRNITTETSQGYHTVRWVKANMNFWAVSDLNEAELISFVQLLLAVPTP